MTKQGEKKKPFKANMGGSDQIPNSLTDLFTDWN